MFKLVRSLCVVAIGTALLFAGAPQLAAQGGGGGGRGGGAAAAPMTPQAYRQGIMMELQANMAALTAVRAGNVGSQSHAIARVTIIQQLAQMLSTAFPEGSTGGRALPAIWTDAAEFGVAVRAAQTAAANLRDAAYNGTPMQIMNAQAAMQSTCGGCHMQFRGPAAP